MTDDQVVTPSPVSESIQHLVFGVKNADKRERTRGRKHEERRKMKTKDEIQTYIAALITQGAREKHVAPPIHRALWRLGINVTPPFNQTFLADWLFTTVMGCLMVVLVIEIYVLTIAVISGAGFLLASLDEIPGGALLFGFVFALLIGLWGAGYRQYYRKRLTIPQW